MELQSIITLASKSVELYFRAMERSLRATGCRLPLKVIPFSDDRFNLPEGATWWEVPEFIEWIGANGRRPVMRKYQALLASNYQFVDTDVIFLRNPEKVLATHSGFVTSCGHWHNPGQTLTNESLALLKSKTTTWQSRVFNTGQFAGENALYDFEGLRAMADNPRYRGTVLDNRFHEQPGINLLVNLSGCEITNLTLPPNNMESTWAGDYLGEEYAQYWGNSARKPYLIHWAGAKMHPEHPISELFFAHLTEEERTLFLRKMEAIKNLGPRARLRARLRKAWHAFRE